MYKGISKGTLGNTAGTQIELQQKKLDDLDYEIGEENIVLNDDTGESYRKASYLAKLSLELERYDDALIYVEEMVKLNDSEFTDEERDIFITAFRFLISEKRKSWRISYK